MREPLIHSHVTDELPDDHPLAYQQVCCERCEVLVHAGTNETMCTWVETGRGPHCLGCFTTLTSFTFSRFGERRGYVVDDHWGLPDA